MASDVYVVLGGNIIKISLENTVVYQKAVTDFMCGNSWIILCHALELSAHAKSRYLRLKAGSEKAVLYNPSL